MLYCKLTITFIGDLWLLCFLPFLALDSLRSPAINDSNCLILEFARCFNRRLRVFSLSLVRKV